MSLVDALIIAVIQGITELFPVASLGHAVVLPPLLGISVDQRAPEFLPFLVILHLGTALALLIYFRWDWIDLGLAVIGRGQPERRADDLKVLFLLVLGTIPAAVLGYALNHTLRGLFASPSYAAGFLIVNGFILWAGEMLRARAGDCGLVTMRGRTALFIGTAQALALFPGISRSGVTMVGGLLAGLTHEASARFSFLLATPIIVGAGVLEVPKLLHAPTPPTGSLMPIFLIAGAVAGVVAYISVALLMRWFRAHEVQALRPFAIYCVALGALVLVLGR